MKRSVVCPELQWSVKTVVIGSDLSLLHYYIIDSTENIINLIMSRYGVIIIHQIK
jgi:hypothetical protein